MADAAAARREARRRRILENCNNRLDLISGKNNSEECSRESSTTRIYTEPVFESPEPSVVDTHSHVQGIYNGMVTSVDAPIPQISQAPSPVAGGNRQIANDLATFAFLSSSSKDAEKKEKSPLGKIVEYKFDIVLLALLNQLFYFVFGLEFTYFFLPLMLYTIPKVILFPAQSKSSLASMLLLMNGMSANKAQILTSILQWATEFFTEISIYLFITICAQSLVTLNNHIKFT